MKAHGRWAGVAAIGSLVAMAVATSAWAVPSTIAVEGIFSATGGGPAADGDYAVAVGLYAAETGGQPTWTEGPLTVKVKNGLFELVLGAQNALDAKAIQGQGAVWLGVAIGSDPELPRKTLRSVPYAVRAAVSAGLECSGCVTSGHLDPQVLAPYAKTADLAKVANSGAYADLAGAPNLAKLATTGAWSDVAGKPTFSDVAVTGAYADLSGTPALAKVATTGGYGDLAGLPVLPEVGKACGTGLVMQGIQADGSYDCVAGGEVTADKLPKDGLDEISNGLLYNQFNEVAASAKAVGIPDNNPVGVSDVIDVPDFGTAQALTVSVDVENSDTSNLKILLLDPDNTKYTLWDKGAKATALKTTWPTPTKTVSGDLTAWTGKNPKGKWYLQVIDTGFLNNAVDGQIKAWSIQVQVLANAKVGVGGALLLKNAADPPFPCGPSVAGALYFDTKTNAIRYCALGVWRSLADTCGNGIVEVTEDCDDGNNANGDGCSATCVASVGYAKAKPGTSCLDILNKAKAEGLTPKDGPMWVDVTGGDATDAFQVLCNMTRDGGGWTLGLKHWYQSGMQGNAAAVGSIADTQVHNGTPYKLSDTAIKAIVGGDNKYDVMGDQIGYNTTYSNGNYEYVVIRNYTAAWTWTTAVAASATTTNMESFRISDNASAWKGNLACGSWGSWGINCYDVIAGNNPNGGSGCGINMGKQSSSGWHHFYMADTNSDTYLYICNGAQHTSSHNMAHRFWFR
jgi:cysteine-rich repeat protein